MIWDKIPTTDWFLNLCTNLPHKQIPLCPAFASRGLRQKGSVLQLNPQGFVGPGGSPGLWSGCWSSGRPAQMSRGPVCSEFLEGETWALRCSSDFLLKKSMPWESNRVLEDQPPPPSQLHHHHYPPPLPQASGLSLCFSFWINENALPTARSSNFLYSLKASAGHTQGFVFLFWW